MLDFFISVKICSIFSSDVDFGLFGFGVLRILGFFVFWFLNFWDKYEEMWLGRGSYLVECFVCVVAVGFEGAPQRVV